MISTITALDNDICYDFNVSGSPSLPNRAASASHTTCGPRPIYKQNRSAEKCKEMVHKIIFTNSSITANTSSFSKSLAKINTCIIMKTTGPS